MDRVYLAYLISGELITSLDYYGQPEESPQQIFVWSLGFSKGGGWSFPGHGEQEVWPSLGANLGSFLCHVTETADLLRGDGTVNIQDRTLSNVCCQAKDLGVQTEKILETEQLKPSNRLCLLKQGSSQGAHWDAFQTVEDILQDSETT